MDAALRCAGGGMLTRMHGRLLGCGGRCCRLAALCFGLALAAHAHALLVLVLLQREGGTGPEGEMCSGKLARCRAQWDARCVQVGRCAGKPKHWP